MKKLLLLIAALTAVIDSSAAKKAKLEPWQDPNVFEENRLPMRATFVTDQQRTLSLNGIWKFHWNESPDVRTRGFEAAGFDDSSWDTMPVPGLLELNGYGEPLYVNIGYAWRGHYKNNPPYPPTEQNYVAQYRRTFELPDDWKGSNVFLCIGSATSNVTTAKSCYSKNISYETRSNIIR